uniref:AAA+ ATPase domain-containing protein n=1 Tax=Romanomermis culicivorax TaxID=13658 RepID=A0A915HNL1_ROMCU
MPYLVSSVVEILRLPLEESDGAGNVHEDSRKNTGVVIKTSRRNTIFLPVVGLVDIKDLKPNDMIACQRETNIVMEKLPDEYDNRVKAMEVFHRPDQKLDDIGGLSKPIREMTEAIILPMTRPELFRKLNIKPPKGVLMYGEPGTGKTMLARMVAAQTKCTFVRLGGAEVVQMYAGEGAKMIRDVFKLARDKAPAIIFIDEIDALATKRYNTDRAGDREAQRTMLELLSQLDGFQPDDNIKVVAATNRVETLDPALIRSGRLDRKVELPMPDETARENIIKIHSKKMTTDKNINFKEIAAAATEFSGAECKAVCVEAGMIALRRNASKINHEDMMDAILEVKAKMKGPKTYFV